MNTDIFMSTEKFSFHRLWAVLLRYYYGSKRSLDRLADVFYWPVIDLLLWGLTSSYFESIIGTNSTFLISVVSGLSLWTIVFLGTSTFAVNTLTEMWDRNLMNLLISPLTFLEWVIGSILVGIIKSLIGFFLTITLAFFMYKINIFTHVLHFIPHIALLFMSCWWIGLFINGLLMRFGTRFQFLAWSLVYVISPISGVFYPISSLPKTAQVISKFLPTSYVFEDMRGIINNVNHSHNGLIIAFCINIFYFILALLYYKSSIRKALNSGLASLY